MSNYYFVLNAHLFYNYFLHRFKIMAKIKILSPQEEKTFKSVPSFNLQKRKSVFSLTPLIKKEIKSLKTENAKIAFVLLLGYFKTTGKFFDKTKFEKKDFDFVLKQLKIQMTFSDFLDNYERYLFHRQKKAVLKFTHHTEFDQIQAVNFLSTQVQYSMNARKLFFTIVDWLIEHSIEVPSYFKLTELVNETIQNYEEKLKSTLSLFLTEKEKLLLDSLFDKDEYNQYKITLLKSISQSDNVSKIKTSIQEFLTIQNLFKELDFVIQKLNLDLNTWRSYAYWVDKSRSYNLLKKEDTIARYLYSIAFIVHQQSYRSDSFVKICLNIQNKIKNRFQEYEKEWIYQKKEIQDALVKMSTKKVENYKFQWEKTKQILAKETLSNDEKIQQMNLMVQEQENTIQEFDKKWKELKLDEYKLSEKSLYHEFLPTQYIYLNQRIGQILKILDFDEKSSDPNLIEAIKNYKEMSKNSFCESILPLFEDLKGVYLSNGKINFRHCKSQFFLMICEAIKSGKLNLKYSYKYLSMEKYLIPFEEWEKNKQGLLQQTNLLNFENVNTVLSSLSMELNTQYDTTNQHFLDGKNPYLSIKQNPIITTPGSYKPQEDVVSDLLEPFHFVSIKDILLATHEQTHFMDSLKHQNKDFSSKRPDLNTLVAGIMSYGCNIGYYKMAKISKGINLYTLQNTIQWYFHQECIEEANERIIKLTKSLSIYQLFKKDMLQHTSSDGQKYNMAVESLNANYSFKYFGKEKGVSVYGFVDEGISTFYSTVISASEREATYVLDGLLHNDLYWEEDKEWLHHTDTHGQSEVMFAATNLLGISLAPRIKDLKKKTLYGFKRPSEYKNQDYIFTPRQTINQEIIRKEWDEVLRLMVTIKTKRTTASTIFNRLSSYTKQHPLYQALSQLGRIYRSIYILKYYDELELRNSTEDMLNKMERSHQFAKAIFFDNNQKIKQELKEDQDITMNCRILIQNAIILWNCLQLSQLLLETHDPVKKQEIISIIQKGTASTWKHVNLQGIYDFIAPKKSNLYFSKIEEILKMKL